VLLLLERCWHLYLCTLVGLLPSLFKPHHKKDEQSKDEKSTIAPQKNRMLRRHRGMDQESIEQGNTIREQHKHKEKWIQLFLCQQHSFSF
jgi:hypothetical protein